MSLALAPPCPVVGQGSGYRELGVDAWRYEGGLKNNQKHQLQTTRTQGDRPQGRPHGETTRGNHSGDHEKKTSPGPVLESTFVNSFLANEAPACAFFTLMVKSSSSASSSKRDKKNFDKCLCGKRMRGSANPARRESHHAQSSTLGFLCDRAPCSICRRVRHRVGLLAGDRKAAPRGLHEHCANVRK